MSRGSCRLLVVSCQATKPNNQQPTTETQQPTTKIMKYTDLDVWKESRKLVSQVYLLSKNFPKEELYGLTNQLRRSVVSVPSNIAEGCGRQSSKETIHFLFIARGSLYEVETQLFLSKDLEYIDKKQLKNVLEQVNSCMKLLNGFINYYKKK